MLAPVAENRAAALGPSRFDWWQDWRGECVAIVASGPSTKGANVALLRDRIHVIAIKENVNLCPWAEVVYGCDEPWWRHRRGLPDYKGIKLTYADRVCREYRDVHRIDVKKAEDKILLDNPGVVGSGGNSGFQSLNIGVQFGVTGVILVGFDMQGRGGEHWYGRNNWANANNPSEFNFPRWRNAFNAVAPDLANRGIEVIDASPIGALKCFRKMSIEGALARWGL